MKESHSRHRASMLLCSRSGGNAQSGATAERSNARALHVALNRFRLQPCAAARFPSSPGPTVARFAAVNLEWSSSSAPHKSPLAAPHSGSRRNSFTGRKSVLPTHDSAHLGSAELISDELRGNICRLKRRAAAEHLHRRA